MSTGTRALGTVIVYMAAAIVAELVLEIALIVTNHGEFPAILWPVLLLGPVVGIVVASRYWSESEFVQGRRVTTPLLFILLLVGALAASSLFFARPTVAPAPRTSLPQVSPSALPSLPPAPTHDLRGGNA
jgi:hypothetical protein